MKYLYLFICCLCLTMVCSCESNKDSIQITNTNDYKFFVDYSVANQVKQAKENLEFWEGKLKKNPTQHTYLSKIATAQTLLFQLTGTINYLTKAEENLKLLTTVSTVSSHKRQLARNYISQHKFQESLQVLLEAEKNADDLKATQKMLFDTYLELGNTSKAKSYLDSIYNLSDFDYLIRAAKYSDAKGNLDHAILLLEKALNRAKLKNNKSLLVWTYSNLADFYGHNNEIKKSYEYYIKTLQLDSANFHAKKGIAWILYSHEKNPTKALEVINQISKEHNSPDYFLIKAEIADYNKNEELKNHYLQLFLKSSSKKEFGAMYNQHKINIYLDELNETSKALTLIYQELKNRPTPLSYSLLAWSYFKIGNQKKAQEIIENNVLNKSFEPEISYRIAAIFKDNNDKRFKEYIKELKTSLYELGPLYTQKIEKL